MNFTNVKIKPHPGIWGLKLDFGLTGPREVHNPNSNFRTYVPSVLQNVKLNKLHYLNIKIYLQLGAWDLRTSFGSIGPKRLTKP